MNICPNLNNKEIKKEFNELVDIFGENIAYYIWDITDGEGLLNHTFNDFMELSNDRAYALSAAAIEARARHNGTFMKAPNGKDSNLNRILWIQARTPQFKELFGDWENNSEITIYAIDKNGEPDVKYLEASYNLMHNESEKILKNILNNLKHIVYNTKYGYFITKSNENNNTRNFIEEVCKQYGYKPYFIEYERATGVIFKEIPEIKTTTDKIDAETSSSEEEIILVITFLTKKFPGLSVRLINEDLIPSLINTRANAFVKNGNVYLIRNRISADIAIEECLHPFVALLEENNKELFDSLFVEAANDFKKLWHQIKGIYDEKHGFTESDRRNELVTQALSRYIREYRKENKPIKIRTLIKKFFAWLGSTINDALYVLGNGNIFVDETKLPRMTLYDLASMISTEDIRFHIRKNNFVRYSLSQDILQNDEYDNILSQMPNLNSEESMAYAARTAIDRTRLAYLDSEQAKFEEQYIQELKNKLNPTSFFNKVLLFFKSVFGSTRIKDPSAKKKETARIQAFAEFNETLRSLIIDNLKSVLNNDYISIQIDSFYNNKQFDAISTILDLIDKQIKHGYIVIQTRSNLYNALLLDSYFTDLIKTEFKSVDEFVDAYLDTNRNKYSKSKLDVIDDINNRIILIIDDVVNSLDHYSFPHIVSFYYSQDFNLINENRRIYDKIKHGYKSRLISVEKSSIRSSKDTILKIKQKIQSLENIDRIDPETIYVVLNDFIDNADNELYELINYFNQCLQGTRSIDPGTLMYISTDILGFYEAIISNDIVNISTDSTGMTLDKVDDIQNKITGHINIGLLQAAQLYQQVCNKYLDSFIDSFIEDQVGIGSKEALKYRFKQILLGEILNGHVSKFELWVGDANNSSSIVIRGIQHMLNDVDREINRRSVHKGHALMALFDKYKSKFNFLDPRNPFKSFVELDENGYPTGNFVRNVNYGRFQKALQNKHKELSNKYSVPLNKNGNPIWNFEISGQEDVYNKYMNELDDWLDIHCNRRYKAEYYKQRRRILSRDTIEVLDLINSQIRLLLEKCTDRKTGFIFVNRLSQQERIRLDYYYQSLDELSMPYTVIRNSSTGIKSFEPKTGDQLRMAEELQEWNAIVNQHVKRSSDKHKYSQAYSQLETDSDRKIFEDYNTRTQISEEFYELLQKCGTATQTEDYLIQSALLNKMINLSKNKKGYYQPNLLVYGEEAWREIKRVELEKDALKTKGDKGSVEFDDIAIQLPVQMRNPKDPTKYISVLSYLTEQARLQGKNPYELYYKRVVSQGKVVYQPLSVFYYLAPKNPYYVETVPINSYSKLTGGDWVNKDFDQDSNEQYQPKESVYKNKAYNDIISDPDKKEFYNAIISTMEEALDLLPAYKNFSKYRMPQITAESDDIIERYAAKLNIKGIGKALKLKIEVNENDDEIYSEDLAKRPDGSFVLSVNIRYINSLADPSIISTDVLGSVLRFYEMALNFNEKSKVVPIVQLMINNMRKYNKESSAADRVNTILEMYGLGKMQKGIGDDNKKMGFWQSFFTNLLNSLRAFASKLLLAGNLISGIKGTIAGTYQTFALAFIGRQYDFGDWFWTIGQMFKGLPNAMRSIMHGNTYSKIQAAMQHNGLATDIQNSFANRHKVGHKQLKRLFSMWMFTHGDYMNNVIVMLSTYHSYRLIQDPETNEFVILNELEYIDRCLKYNISETDSIKLFEKYSRNNLWDMYAITKTGDFVLKNKIVIIDKNGNKLTIDPKKYVTKKIENRISGGSENKASIINGVVNPHGQSAAYQNPITRMLVLMRGFLISQGWDRLKQGNDFVNTYYDKGKIRNFDNNSNVRGQFNFETGNVEPGVYSSVKHCVTFFFKEYIPNALNSLVHLKKISTNSKLSRSDIMSAKQFVADIVGTAMFFGLAALTVLFGIQRYPDEWWPYALALIFAGSAIEIATPISIGTISDLWTSVTVCQKLLDNYMSVFKKVAEVLGYGEKDPNEIIDRYAYKGNPRWFKDTMESIGLVLGSDSWSLMGYYKTFSPTIPGLTDKDKNEYVNRLTKSINNLQDNDLSYILSPKGVQDVSNIFTTPLGIKQKYNYYSKHIWPATMLPDTDPNKSKNKNKNKSKRSIKKPSENKIKR